MLSEAVGEQGAFSASRKDVIGIIVCMKERWCSL